MSPSKDSSSQSKTTTVFSERWAMVTLGALFAVNAVSLDSSLVAIPSIAAYFDETSGRSQLILALFLLGYALGHIPAGLLGDRFGRRPVILIGMALSALLAFLAAIAPSFDILLIARFTQGLCAATGGLLAKAMVRDVASGTASSRLNSKASSYVAALIIITPLAASLLITLYDWRAVMVMIFCYFLIVTASTFFFVPETLRKDSSQAGTSSWQQFMTSMRAFCATPQSYFASFYGAIIFSSYFIFNTSGASVLVDVYDLPASYFGPIFALTSAAQLAALLLNARNVDKFGIFKMLTIGISFSVLAFAFASIALIVGKMPLILFVTIGVALSLSLGMTLANSIALTLDPLPNTAGFAAAIQGMIQTGLAALVGILVSNVYDGTTRNILSLFIGCALVNCAAFVCLTVARHYKVTK